MPLRHRVARGNHRRNWNRSPSRCVRGHPRASRQGTRSHGCVLAIQAMAGRKRPRRSLGGDRFQLRGSGYVPARGGLAIKRTDARSAAVLDPAEAEYVRSGGGCKEISCHRDPGPVSCRPLTPGASSQCPGQRLRLPPSTKFAENGQPESFLGGGPLPGNRAVHFSPCNPKLSKGLEKVDQVDHRVWSSASPRTSTT